MNILKKIFSTFNISTVESSAKKESAIVSAANTPSEPKGIEWKTKEKPSIGTFNALVVADGHDHITQSLLQDVVDKIPDIVFLLGDNSHDDIEAVLYFLDDYRFKAPVLGVEGNHDMEGILCGHNIENLHGKVIEWNGFRIGGISGSIRYKDEPGYCMMTSDESEVLVEKMQPCDILLTHDKPCFGYPEAITPHSGLSGIGTYIETNQPKLLLHGHIHDRYVKQYKNTIIRCCFRAEMITISI